MGRSIAPSPNHRSPSCRLPGCQTSRWPHRLAVLLACATFPLIWVGGLVTTYDAGMAVPDWPTTYGYNLFLYPWQTWLFGPWDLFIEHGHRLLGAVVGMLTLALAACIWKLDGRLWMRWLGLAAVAGVIFQGVLGGLRVRMDERFLAQIHGCVGPAFFALGAALATLTSRRWFSASADEKEDGNLLPQRPEGCIAQKVPVPCFGSPTPRLHRLATATAAIAYVQLVLGSQLRHVQVTADANLFRIAVWFHLLMAATLAGHVIGLWARSRRESSGNTWLTRPAHLLAALVGLQIALGCGAWIVNYGWPSWLADYRWAAGYVVRRESFLQATVTTAHVATGSLILALSVVLALRAWRIWAEKGVGNLLREAPSGPIRQKAPNDRVLRTVGAIA